MRVLVRLLSDLRNIPFILAETIASMPHRYVPTYTNYQYQSASFGTAAYSM